MVRQRLKHVLVGGRAVKYLFKTIELFGR